MRPSGRGAACRGAARSGLKTVHRTVFRAPFTLHRRAGRRGHDRARSPLCLKQWRSNGSSSRARWTALHSPLTSKSCSCPNAPPAPSFVGKTIHRIIFSSSSFLANLATHTNTAAAKALHDAGCRFLFLPPYSPDPNPIEINRALSRTHGVRALIFSKLKARLRRTGARTFTDVFRAIAESCDLFSPNECRNHLNAAGYGAG